MRKKERKKPCKTKAGSEITSLAVKPPNWCQ